MNTVKELSLLTYNELENQVEALETDGYVYFPNVLNSEEVCLLRSIMDRLPAIPESHDRDESPENGAAFIHKLISNSFNRDPLFLQFLDRSPVIEVAEAAHGEDCHCIGMHSWLTGPGRPDQGLHTDWLPISLPPEVLSDPRVKIPIFITTAHYYLNDMYEALGPTKFVPSSHFSGCSPNGATEWNNRREESILCKAGDVVLFRSEVWHRGSANTSDEVRYLLQVHYAQRMITQKYPPYLNKFQFNEAILLQANPRQKRLLGDHHPSNYD